MNSCSLPVCNAQFDQLLDLDYCVPHETALEHKDSEWVVHHNPLLKNSCMLHHIYKSIIFTLNMFWFIYNYALLQQMKNSNYYTPISWMKISISKFSTDTVYITYSTNQSLKDKTKHVLDQSWQHATRASHNSYYLYTDTMQRTCPWRNPFLLLLRQTLIEGTQDSSHWHFFSCLLNIPSNRKSVHQECIYADNFVCCHTEMEVADQISYPVHSIPT